MADFHEAAKTGLLLAREHVEVLPDKIADAVAALPLGRQRAGSVYYRALSDVCLSTFKEACQVLAETMVRIKRAHAVSHRSDEFAAALTEIRTAVQAVYDDHDTHPGFAERTPFVERLTKAEEILLAKFRNGVIGMPNERTAPTSQVTNITMRDNHGNMATVTGGSTFSGGQKQGPSDSDLRDALASLEEAIRTSELAPEEIDRGLDQVALASSELQGKKEPSRMKRFVNATFDFATKVGSSTTAGVILAYAKAHGLVP